jgi:hypothetical protein
MLMLEAKTFCLSCERPVLVRTTESTGGYCMRCFKLPSDEREDSRRARGPATFASIEQSLRETLRNHIPLVCRLLGAERIYGFALFTDPFYELITSCVFTETGFQQRVEEYRRKRPTVHGVDRPLDDIARGLRWNPSDSPYFAFRETEDFHALHLRVGDLWRDIPRDDESRVKSTITALEGICIAGLRELRSSHVVPSPLILLLLQGDQGPEERFALAELFNPPDAIQHLWRDWVPDKAQVDHYRARFAHHHLNVTKP